MVDGLRLSWAAVTWGAAWYARHFWLVFGLSTIPTAQRFVAVRWGDHLPPVADVGLELLTAAVRLLLVGMIVYLAWRKDPVLAGLGLRATGSRIAASIDRHRAAFGVQFLVLGAAFGLFDILPGAAIAAWVPAGQRELVQAIVVAAKNPTVIAFTFVWEVGVARQLALRGAAPAAPAPAEPAR